MSCGKDDKRPGACTSKEKKKIGVKIKYGDLNRVFTLFHT